MAFWGIEVKPGKPFTHSFDESKGRLHVSMASLGLGSATLKSVLQCNVGNKSPVFLCSLYPEKSESLQLNLEFEEVDEVLFSVIGPRSIHLSGYYMGGGRFHSLKEESESFGEDIADTDSHRSNHSDEDEYDDSFINDNEPEVFPPSPISNSEEESWDDKKPRNKKGNCKRRLKKAFRVSESEEEDFPRPKINTNGNSAAPKLQSEDEDNCPISTYFKNGINSKKGTHNGGESCNKSTGQSDLPIDPLPTSEDGQNDGLTPKKKRKERSKSEKVTESQQVSKITEDSGELADKNDERPKKKKRGESKKKKDLIDVKENEEKQDEAKEEKESEEKSVKKRKKKKTEKVQADGEAVNNIETPRLPIEEKNTSLTDGELKKTDAKASQAQTYGLVIEELQSGKPEGKLAVLGNKISIRFVGKLKNTGQVIDSNMDSDLFKFRLGARKVIEGLDIGLEGMRVGEKRRLTVPPLMGYGSEGDGKNIPGDSWLVYEVELIKVR